MRRWTKHVTIKWTPEQFERLEKAWKLSEYHWKGRSWFVRNAAMAEAEKVLAHHETPRKKTSKRRKAA